MAAEHPRGWRRPLWWLYRHPDLLDAVASLSWPLAWILALRHDYTPSVFLAAAAVLSRRAHIYTMSTRLRLAVAIAARNAQRGEAVPPGGD